MTTTESRTEPVIPVARIRRSYAGAVYELLCHDRDVTVEPAYDGDYTVTAGHVRVHFTARAVEIAFPDPYGEPECDPVVVTIIGPYTLGAIVTLVSGLLGQLAVTP
jgi:hypothetical protein